MNKGNQIRVDRIKAVLAQFYAEGDQATGITDILADIRHFCSAHDLVVAEALRVSMIHYVAEAGPGHEEGF